MSDTSDADDGGFDKEAEREKLRKKFEEEEESRKATQHMSELLLKGATMTNSHCNQCGSPIFRHDGQEFCPTCGEGMPAEGDDQGAEADDEPIDVPSQEARDPSDAEAGESPGEERTPSRTGTGTSPDAAEGPQTATGGSDQSANAARSGETGAGSNAHEGASGQSARRREAPAASGDRHSRPQESRSGSARGATGDLGEARASLVRTLEGLSRQAEAAEDVRRTRDLLAAAREAAEAIAALDRADR